MCSIVWQADRFHNIEAMQIRERLYAEQKVNKERQVEVDLARSIFILCLALIHCIIACTPEEGLVSGIPYLFDTIIGGPLSAPIYMFAMGIGFAYSKNRGKTNHFHRGVQLFALGYLLNACRYLIPYMIGYGITGNGEKYMMQLPYLFLGNDVLQFAGLATIILAIFVRIGMKDWQMVALSWMASVVGTLLAGVDAKAPFLNICLGYVIGTEDAAEMVVSYFPILNWMVFPVGGYIFGKRLLHLKDKKLFYGILATVCTAVSVVFYASGIYFERGMFGEGQNCYYHMQTLDAFGATMSTLAILGIWHFLKNRMPQCVIQILVNASKHINSIYCIHWVLVVISTDLVLYIVRGTQILPPYLSVLLGVGISIVSVILANIWTEFIKRREYK